MQKNHSNQGNSECFRPFSSGLKRRSTQKTLSVTTRTRPFHFGTKNRRKRAVVPGHWKKDPFVLQKAFFSESINSPTNYAGTVGHSIVCVLFCLVQCLSDGCLGGTSVGTTCEAFHCELSKMAPSKVQKASRPCTKKLRVSMRREPFQCAQFNDSHESGRGILVHCQNSQVSSIVWPSPA